VIVATPTAVVPVVVPVALQQVAHDRRRAAQAKAARAGPVVAVKALRLAC